MHFRESSSYKTLCSLYVQPMVLASVSRERNGHTAKGADHMVDSLIVI